MYLYQSEAFLLLPLPIYTVTDCSRYRGYYMAARRYDFYLRVVKTILYSRKQKIVKFHAQKQIGKSHVIDIFTIVIWKISLCIFQYLTFYYIIISMHICHLAMLSACGYIYSRYALHRTEQEPS